MYIDQNLQKALSDRIYEKRKPAALQLEQIVRKAVEQKNMEMVDGVITELSRDFAYALRHPNYRNGGLIGLAAVAIALGQESLPVYLDDIIQPILACFGDADARVRYYACESLYNVAKIAKGEILAYFSEIFDALCKLTADVEELVRNGANLVDQLLRDIIVETAATYVFVVNRDPPKVPSPVSQPEGPEGPTIQQGPTQAERQGSFSLERFIPLLVERIYVMNPATRMFLVQWIMLLDSIPDLELIKFLPEFLEGLLLFLTDSHKEVRVFTKTCLEKLLKDIKEVDSLQKSAKHPGNSRNDAGSASAASGGSGVDAGLYQIGQDTFIYYSQIVDIVLGKMDPSHNEIQLVVLDWIEGILEVSPSDVLAKLPTLVSVLFSSLSDENTELRKAGNRLNEHLLKMLNDHSTVVDTPAAIQALGRQLDNEDKVTRLTALRWLSALYSASSRAPFSLNTASSHDDLLVKLMMPLSDPSDEVVMQDLNLLASILNDADGSELQAFGVELMDRFKQNLQLFSHRGKFVCLHLCILLGSDRVFRTFAEILGKSESEESSGDSDGFPSLMIQNLTNILLTAPELHSFRRQLTELDTKQGSDLFSTLFLNWRKNSAAILALCLLAEDYYHAYEVLEVLARFDVTVSTLIRIDKLVQLIEGPVFAPLRMHLLQPQKYHYLYKTLYGLLMVLPQSKAFTTLQTRLNSVIGYSQLPPNTSQKGSPKASKPEPENVVDWDTLLSKFREIYEPR